MTARVTDATRARRATGLEPRRRSAGLAWIDRLQAFIVMVILKSFCGAEERGDEVSSMLGRRFDRTRGDEGDIYTKRVRGRIGTGAHLEFSEAGGRREARSGMSVYGSSRPKTARSVARRNFDQ